MTTKQSYNLTADAYAKNVSTLVPVDQIAHFLQLLPPQASIIDIGCGSGRDAKIFAEGGLIPQSGYKVTGIDFSEAMITAAKAHAPLAHFEVMDMESLNFPEHSFDGAWAAASLLHTPKVKILKVLKGIHAILKPKGLFYLSLKQGIGEGVEADLRYGNIEKYWSYFQEEEIRHYLAAAHFNILSLSVSKPKTAYQTHPSIHIFAEKMTSAFIV
jgi:SAM-dependent methyltransferase